MNRLLKIVLNSASLLLTLVINYLSNTDLIGSGTVGSISAKYPTVITPAGYAFSIWGLIYLMLLFFAGFQWYALLKKRYEDVIDSTGFYFVLANLANASWVIAWVNNSIGLSVLLILLLLWSLVRLVQNLNLEKWDAPVLIIFFVWWPVAIYFGWVILATVLNVQVFVASIGWDQKTLSAAVFGVFLIALSMSVYLFLTYRRNLRESAGVGVWGLVAVAVSQSGSNPFIAVSALAASVVLLFFIILHAYRNREYSVFSKFQKTE
ncbi:MAG: hypothetical protein ACLFVE_09390 [Chitinispirillaceae bacterium]